MDWRYPQLPLQQTKGNLGVPPQAESPFPDFCDQKAQSISSTGPGEDSGASLAGKQVSLGLRTAPLTLLPPPATLSAPRKTWAFPARRHQPGPREAAAATAHQLFSPTPAGAGPALFALSQPGPVRPGPWVLRVGRSAGRWMGRWEREAGWLCKAAGTGGRDRGRITLSPPALGVGTRQPKVAAAMPGRVFPGKRRLRVGSQR